MTHLPINLQEKKQADSPEARSAHRRRYSQDPMRKAYYRCSRTLRGARRLLGTTPVPFTVQLIHQFA